MDCQPESSWLPGQKGLWTQSWLAAMRSTCYSKTLGPSPGCTPSPGVEYWQVLSCPGLGRQWRVWCWEEQGRTTGSPPSWGLLSAHPLASKLTMSHALHVVFVTCCPVGQYRHFPGFEVRKVRFGEGSGSPKPHSQSGVSHWVRYLLVECLRWGWAGDLECGTDGSAVGVLLPLLSRVVCAQCPLPPIHSLGGLRRGAGGWSQPPPCGKLPTHSLPQPAQCPCLGSTTYYDLRQATHAASAMISSSVQWVQSSHHRPQWVQWRIKETVCVQGSLCWHHGKHPGKTPALSLGRF